jgi:hypothetical protein
VKRALPLLATALLAAGCGGSGGADAPVRAMMDRYLTGMVRHDYAKVCDQLAPEIAARHRFPGAPADCAQAMDAETHGLDGYPGVHPDRANEDMALVRVERVTMLGDRAQVYVHDPFGGDTIVLAIRRAGRWLLLQEPGGISIPADAAGSGPFD